MSTMNEVMYRSQSILKLLIIFFEVTLSHNYNTYELKDMSIRDQYYYSENLHTRKCGTPPLELL